MIYPAVIIRQRRLTVVSAQYFCYQRCLSLWSPGAVSIKQCSYLPLSESQRLFFILLPDLLFYLASLNVFFLILLHGLLFVGCWSESNPTQTLLTRATFEPASVFISFDIAPYNRMQVCKCILAVALPEPLSWQSHGVVLRARSGLDMLAALPCCSSWPIYMFVCLCSPMLLRGNFCVGASSLSLCLPRRQLQGSMYRFGRWPQDPGCIRPVIKVL